MKKIIDKRLITITSAILVLGIIAGLLFLAFTTSLDKLIIKKEITDFFELLSSGSSSIGGVFTSFKYNMIYIILITISSIIYVFFPLVLFINFYKGMLIGFLISSVVMTYKVKGVMYAILIIFPHHIIMPIVLVIYSSVCLKFTYKLMRGTYKKESINLNAFIKKLGVLFLIATGASLVSSILEIYLCPFLLKFFV